MKCTTITMNGGGKAIVCGSQRVKTCNCGKINTRLCDWKMGPGITCDAMLCSGCTTEPVEGKDLCRYHAELLGMINSTDLPKMPRQ